MGVISTVQPSAGTFHKVSSSQAKVGLKAAFTCSVCGSQFIASSRLRQHMEKHNQDGYPCHFCGKRYTFKSNLFRHHKFCQMKKFSQNSNQ